MSENQPIWINWARALQRWGMREGVASALEAAGSLNVLFAQLLYLSQPLLSGTVSAYSLHALAQVLENPTDRREFVSFLKEAPTRGTVA